MIHAFNRYLHTHSKKSRTYGIISCRLFSTVAFIGNALQNDDLNSKLQGSTLCDHLKIGRIRHINL